MAFNSSFSLPWPPRPKSRHGAFISSSPLLPSSLYGPWVLWDPSPSLSRIRSSRSTVSGSACSPSWPPGPFPRLCTHVSLVRSSLRPSGRSWLPGKLFFTCASRPSSDGLSGARLGEYFSTCRFARSLTCSDLFWSALGRFLMPSSSLDVASASASAVVRPTSWPAEHHSPSSSMLGGLFLCCGHCTGLLGGL